ncbi:MAG: PIN domain-containing protein [Thermoplasmataceae archaeon]|jgi:predicted nucleic acid-binding protein
MKDEIFCDTNVLYYAYDLSEPEKRKICKSLISKIFMGEIKCVLSNQILLELYNALTRKLGVKSDMAKAIVDSFITSDNWSKISYNHKTVAYLRRDNSLW